MVYWTHCIHEGETRLRILCSTLCLHFKMDVANLEDNRWCHMGHAYRWRRGVLSPEAAGFRSIRERDSGWQNRTQWWIFWGGWFGITIYPGNNQKDHNVELAASKWPHDWTPGIVQRETGLIRDSVNLIIWGVQGWEMWEAPGRLP